MTSCRYHCGPPRKMSLSRFHYYSPCRHGHHTYTNPRNKKGKASYIIRMYTEPICGSTRNCRKNGWSLWRPPPSFVVSRQQMRRTCNHALCSLVSFSRFLHLLLQFSTIPVSFVLDERYMEGTHLTCASSCTALSFPPCFSVLIFSPAIRNLFSYSLTRASHLFSA